jgi:integrase
MAKIKQLSDDIVRNAGPGMHLDGWGLYLQVTLAADGSLNKSWVLRFATGRTVTSASGKQRREERSMGLGSIASINLVKARALAGHYREKLAEGLDPIEQRRATLKAKAEEHRKATRDRTFNQCADDFLADRRAGWSNPKHAKQWESTLKSYARPLLGKLSVRAIDTEHLKKVLRPIWTSKPETANRVRGRIEAVLNWATALGYREGPNPARWHGHLENLLPARATVREVKHHAALPYSELPRFLGALRAQETTSARGFEFLILTAARTGEVIGARWSEIDMAAKVWTVPADRMKGRKGKRREHRVPLSAAAMAILKTQAAIQENEYVFPGDRRAGLSDMALLMTLRRMGREDVTPHGFRSTFRDWAGNETNFPRELAEAALAHVVGDKAEQAYHRSDALEKRRRLMEAWANYCCSKPATAKIVPLRA